MMWHRINEERWNGFHLDETIYARLPPLDEFRIKCDESLWNSKYEIIDYIWSEFYLWFHLCFVNVALMETTKWNHPLGLALLTDERCRVQKIFISDFIAFVTYSSKWVPSELRSQSDLVMSWITVCFRTLEINLEQWWLVVILTLQIKMPFCYAHAEFLASLANYWRTIYGHYIYATISISSSSGGLLVFISTDIIFLIRVTSVNL